MPPCSTSRGDYTFGTAIGGHTVQQPCEKIAEGRPFGFAYLLCRESGEWAATVNTSQCAYTSAVTDTLHKFAAMNMTFTPRTLMESARQFLNFTADPAVFQDEMDLVYFSHAVENYLPYLVSDEKAAIALVVQSSLRLLMYLGFGYDGSLRIHVYVLQYISYTKFKCARVTLSGSLAKEK